MPPYCRFCDVTQPKLNMQNQIIKVFKNNFATDDVAPNCKYSITSMARTRMARLPWMIRSLFFSPYKIILIAQENKYLGILFLFYH